MNDNVKQALIIGATIVAVAAVVKGLKDCREEIAHFDPLKGVRQFVQNADAKYVSAVASKLNIRSYRQPHRLTLTFPNIRH